MGAPNWNLLTIRRLIEQSIDSVIHLKREKEKRYVESITHIVGLEDYGFILDPIL
jgi:Flp pilus assembly CpaF family ATPase